jgi:hypothetical protein
MFSDAFRQRLARGEHTKWASDLTQAHLQALLWMVGEFISSGYPVFSLVSAYSKELGSDPHLARSRDIIRALCRPDYGIGTDGPTDQPLFSQEFRRELEGGKYTRWARDFSEARLEALLRLIGEFAEHAQPLLDWLDRRAAEARGAYPFIRAQYGLEATVRIVKGERYDVNEATRRIRERVAERDNPGPGWPRH